MNGKIGRAIRPLYNWAEKRLYSSFVGALAQMAYEGSMKAWYHDILADMGPHEIRAIGHGHIGCVLGDETKDAFLYEAGTFTTRRGSWITFTPGEERPKLYKTFFSVADKIEPFTRPLRRARVQDRPVRE